MLNILRYSQIVDLVAINSETADYLGPIEDVWVDENGRIAYLSSPRGYIPLLQVAGVSTQAVSVHGQPTPAPSHRLHRLQKLPVTAAGALPAGEANGWVEDFLFDWETGEVTHYILAGKIAETLDQASAGGLSPEESLSQEESPSQGRRVVLAADNVKTISVKAVVLEEEAHQRLRREPEGLKGFLSEQQYPVRQLVNELSNRLHEKISPEDTRETVHVKIKTVSEDLANNHHPDHHLLGEATDFLHDHWESLQRSAHRASSRAQAAVSSAWEKVKGQSS